MNSSQIPQTPSTAGSSAANANMLGDDYWTKLDSMLDAKIQRIEAKFDAAVEQLDKKIVVLENKCEKYEEDIGNLKSIVSMQQRVISKIDSSERDRNLIISRVSEQDVIYEGKTYHSDKEKLTVLFGLLDVPLPEVEIDRLGKPNPNYDRKIKVVMPDKTSRNNVLKKAKQLKDAHEPWKYVFINSDKHQVVLQEETRLRNKKKNLVSKEENNKQGGNDH